MAREIRQAEIITDLAQYTYDPEEGAVETLHKFAIVLSQDCDLLWDYEAAVMIDFKRCFTLCLQKRFIARQKSTAALGGGVA
jgi:hypothetical protein